MNLVPFYEKQRILDDYIMNSKGLLPSEVLTQKKIIAFKQEFGELLQRLPEVFKFWSNKKNLIDNETLEEWVDGFHFLLSIGNDRGYNEEYHRVSLLFLYDEADLDELTLDIYNSSITTQNSYERAFRLYVAFILKLGYTEAEIETAYETKYQENFARQDRNY